MAQNKNSFLLYIDLIHTVKKLKSEDAGKLFLTILEYVNDLNPVVEEPIIDLVFEPIKQQLKRDLRAWESKSIVRSESGREGGIKSGEVRRLQKEANEANALKSKQKEANEAVSVTVTVNDNVPVTVTEKNKGKKSPVAIAPVTDFNDCKIYFLAFYLEKYQTEYYFQAVDGKKLASLIKKIIFKIKEKEKSSGQKEKDGSVLIGFKAFISEAHKNADSWLQSNFNLSIIDQKFNDIFSSLKNGTSVKKPESQIIKNAKLAASTKNPYL